MTELCEQHKLILIVACEVTDKSRFNRILQSNNNKILGVLTGTRKETARFIVPFTFKIRKKVHQRIQINLTKLFVNHFRHPHQ